MARLKVYFKDRRIYCVLSKESISENLGFLFVPSYSYSFSTYLDTPATRCPESGYNLAAGMTHQFQEPSALSLPAGGPEGPYVLL